MLSAEERSSLLALARRSIEHGLERGQALQISSADFPTALQDERACFVTLNRAGALRGCIGQLEAVQPLVSDVVENAYAAAFRDPRFPPLGSNELRDLELHISVLTPAVPIEFASEEELIRQLRPGLDGLILEEGSLRGTFLPSVWEALGEPQAFLEHLKIKAGLPANYWSGRIKVYRYETESFSAEDIA